MFEDSFKNASDDCENKKRKKLKDVGKEIEKRSHSTRQFLACRETTIERKLKKIRRSKLVAAVPAWYKCVEEIFTDNIRDIALSTKALYSIILFYLRVAVESYPSPLYDRLNNTLCIRTNDPPSYYFRASYIENLRSRE